MRQKNDRQSIERVDEFERTPPRRYKRAEKTDGRFTPGVRMRKRYFDLPPLPDNVERILPGIVCAVLLLFYCNASAPLREVPDVQTRFADWAKAQNTQTVKQLPGATPEPGSALYEAVQFDQQAVVEQAVIEANATPTPAPEEPEFKFYEPGELEYHTDRLDISIEQKHKDGITYFVCDVQLSDVSQMQAAFAGDSFRSGMTESVSDIAGRYGPVLAINADFCQYHKDGVIIRNGELLRKENIRQRHLLIVDSQGNLSAETDRSGKQGLVANRLVQANTWQTFEFGPVLVEDGKAARLPDSFYVRTGEGYDNPRTAIGQKGPLHYIIIVVDGRRDGYSTGASIPQLQQLFLDEGVEFAFNLDGGGSSTLYFLGEVINMPSSGKERSVSDILMFMANPG